MNRELRPHQHQAIAMLRQSLASGKRRPVLQAATGFGKTLLAAAIVEGALRKNNRVLFTVPAISLVDQTVNAFYAEGLHDIGVMQGRHEMTDWSKPVQIASIQTLMRRPLPKADVVIHDECHRMFDFVGKWMAKPEWKSIPMIGLSATPWTKGLGKHYDDLLISATTADLIRDKYLSPFRVFAPSHPDLSHVRTVAGDYHEGDLGDTMDTPPLVADAVENWLQHGEDRPTFCFAVNRAHAKHLAEQFSRAGVPCGYVDSYTDRDEREAIAGQFRRGQIKVVCNVGCLTTGVDWDVRCIILARPTKSEMLFVQMIGRGLRTAPGKADLVVFDHSDTHARLGFVTDIHHESLDDGRERQKAKPRVQPKPSECPKCHFLRPAKVTKCPACGFKAERQCEVEVEDGELVEFGAVASAKVKVSTAEKQAWYSMLLKIADDRGYKPGWSANQYRQRFSTWPRGLSELRANPSPEVSNYVKSRMIAYAKGRKQHDAHPGS